jgi:hypothetical protein
MIDAIAPRVNIVVKNNLYWKLEQLQDTSGREPSPAARHFRP